jgi:hypothetical protein
MTYKFQNNYGMSRIIKLAIICIILSNIGGFCAGYVLGEVQKEKRLRENNFIIEKLKNIPEINS